jgi:uncharacterized protein (DUF2141 family)
MNRYILFLLVLFSQPSFGQQDTSRVANYRPHDTTDSFSVFMENEDAPRPLPGEVTYSITITVTNIRNTKGVIRFKFYDETYPFPDKKGFLRIVVPKTIVKDGTLTVTYDGFISKVMGIALQDDENNNWELDMGWLLPKEGHAFSDYYHTALRRPVFEDFKFLLTGNKQVKMKMRYY